MTQRSHKTTKICPICKIDLPRTDFHQYNRTRGKLKDCSSYCKQCSKTNYLQRKQRAILHRNLSVEDIKEIQCTVCNNYLPVTSFSKDPKNITGYTSRCKSCQSIYSKGYYKTPRAKFLAYKRRAKTNGTDFLLTYEEFMSFYQKPCSYCGSEITTIGIDRVNSKIGYLLDNCKPCCSVCNVMKLDMNLDKWMLHMLKIIMFYRPAEVDILLGDASKAKELLGWIPEIKFEQLVREMVETDTKLLPAS